MLFDLKKANLISINTIIISLQCVWQYSSIWWKIRAWIVYPEFWQKLIYWSSFHFVDWITSHRTRSKTWSDGVGEVKDQLDGSSDSFTYCGWCLWISLVGIPLISLASGFLIFNTTTSYMYQCICPQRVSFVKFYTHRFTILWNWSTTANKL